MVLQMTLIAVNELHELSYNISHALIQYIQAANIEYDCIRMLYLDK